MTIHTDGKLTVSNLAGLPRQLAHLVAGRGDKRATDVGSPDAGDWAVGGEAGGLMVPVRAARDEFRISYGGGTHSMPLTEDRARRYAGEKGGAVERRTVTDWEEVEL